MQPLCQKVLRHLNNEEREAIWTTTSFPKQHQNARQALSLTLERALKSSDKCKLCQKLLSWVILWCWLLGWVGFFRCFGVFLFVWVLFPSPIGEAWRARDLKQNLLLFYSQKAGTFNFWWSLLYLCCSKIQTFVPHISCSNNAFPYTCKKVFIFFYFYWEMLVQYCSLKSLLRITLPFFPSKGKCVIWQLCKNT